MKKIYISMVLVFLTSPIYAGTYFKTGVVRSINIMSSANAAFEDIITIEGATSAGTCPVADGYVSIVVRDDERGKKQLSLLMTAKVSGQLVTAKLVEDRVESSTGRCYLDVLSMP